MPSVRIEDRDLGKTALRVSALGFGCGNVGGLMIRGTAAERERAIARAVELGINYFDTAPSYGDGQSEQRSEEHTSELQSRLHLVCRLLLEKKKNKNGTRSLYELHGTAGMT